MISRCLIALLLILALTASAASAGQSMIPGAFADIGLGARSMGMGGANMAGSGRANDIVWNPAGLAGIEKSEIAAMHTEQFGLVPSYLLTGAKNAGEGFGIGAGILSSGDALLRENTFILGAGKEMALFGGLDLGIALKFRHASFGGEDDGAGVSGSALGSGLDIGLRGQFHSAAIGVVLEDLLAGVRWDSSVSGNYWENVPPTLTAGVRVDAGALELASDLEMPLGTERAWKAAAGVEWSPHSVLQIRGGVRQRLDAEGSRFLTLGAGLGKSLPGGDRIQVDTAYLFHDIDGSLRVSANYIF